MLVGVNETPASSLSYLLTSVSDTDKTALDNVLTGCERLRLLIEILQA